MLNAGSRLGLRFFCLFPPVTDAAIVRTPRLKSTGKDTLFMAPQILTFIIVLAVIFIIFKIFNLSIKIFFKLLINALIGAALLFVFNFVFAGLLNLSFFYINITWLTALITGIFGVPGVVVLMQAFEVFGNSAFWRKTCLPTVIMLKARQFCAQS